MVTSPQLTISPNKIHKPNMTETLKQPKRRHIKSTERKRVQGTKGHSINNTVDMDKTFTSVVNLDHIHSQYLISIKTFPKILYQY